MELAETPERLLPPYAQGKQGILAALQEARERTCLLSDGCADCDLNAPAESYLSPPTWDLGHMANFEELWLVQELAGKAEMHDGFNDIYNAFAHPREERPSLALLDRAGAYAYLAEVRKRACAILEHVELDSHRLTRDGFAYWMIVLHEHQHQETLLQSYALRPDYKIPERRALPAPGRSEPGFETLPAMTFDMGINHGPGSYDNEAPRHPVHVNAFEMARYPVTNGDYLAFMEEGGYDAREHWSKRGQTWLDETSHHAPLGWRQDAGAWSRRTPSGEVPITAVADEILCHVTFFEAEAYASWAGARLPTEAEWERAARGGGGRNPWGDEWASTQQANVDHLGWAPSRIGSHPEGASPEGIHHLIGDVWEWCDTGFDGYPGFEAFPYKEYSEVFFGGDYKILRGGSWATRASCATGTFRNWDHPYRRQIFSGIRLAR